MKIGLGVVAAAAMGAALVSHSARTRAPAPPQQAQPQTPRPLPVPPTIVGMNVSEANNYQAINRLKDVVQNSAQLATVTPHGWAKDPASFEPATLDQNGYIHGVPHGRQIVVSMYGGPHRLTGSFDCHISPGWQYKMFGDPVIEGSGTRFTLKVAPEHGRAAMALMLMPTGASADLTDIGCSLRDDPDPKSPFVPAYLGDLKPFAVIRFMNLMRANSIGHRDWATRATPHSFSQAGPRGWSVEYMVELANEAHADPWFTMPFDADPDYYRQFATYVRDHLAPDRKVYVEYSNEVWNTAFPQGREATRLGQAAYPAVDPYTADDYYYADRVRAVMKIWTEVFAGQEKRLVRVASAIAILPQRADRILAHDQTWRSVDMLATAPYFGSNGFEIKEDGQARVDGLFAEGPKLVNRAIQNALGAKRVAAKYGLRYGTYEGGPGFSNGMPAIQKDLNAMNQDPRMYGLYTLFLNRWRKEVGGLLMLFSLTGASGQYGGWGHLEYTGQPPSESPKMRALIDFIDKLPAQKQPAR